MQTKSYVGIMAITAVGAMALALFMMISLTPLSVGPIGVTAWFVLVMAALTAFVAVVAYGIESHWWSKLPATRRRRNSLRRGLLLGGLGTAVLALSSLKQLNLRDVVLLFLLLLLVEFYTVARS